MKLYDLAGELYNDLGRPTSISVSSIAYWFQTNIGQLNIEIATDYALSSSGESIPELGEKEGAIFKCLFKIHYFEGKIRSSLSTTGYSAITQISSEGVKMRKVNRTAVTKTIRNLKKAAEEELKQLSIEYNKRHVKIASVSIYP